MTPYSLTTGGDDSLNQIVFIRWHQTNNGTKVLYSSNHRITRPLSIKTHIPRFGAFEYDDITRFRITKVVGYFLNKDSIPHTTSTTM